MRDRIVAEAREWIGTPWQHQHRQKGQGVDCAGLVTATAQNLGLSTFDLTDYGRLPDGAEMLRICNREMVRVEVREMQPGDVVCMRIARLPQHIGILGDYPGGGLSMIHADNLLGRVVEHRLDDRWRARIVAAYKLPGVE